MAIGGDSLEENFVIDDSASSSSYQDSVDELEMTHNNAYGLGNESNEEPTGDSDDESSPKAKKSKLNMREAATSSDGSMASQKTMLDMAIRAFEKYFPNVDCPLSRDILGSISFLDCSEFCNQSSKSVRDLLDFIGENTESLSVPTTPQLKTLVITGSGTRAMYIVKELREFDKNLSPLPLFFHGGGRKKEQTKTHESVLSNSKAVVAVSLPSRLVDATKKGLVDVDKLELVIVDLKANEKGVNVLSQKDTMHDVLTFIGQFTLSGTKMVKIAMV